MVDRETEVKAPSHKVLWKRLLSVLAVPRATQSRECAWSKCSVPRDLPRGLGSCFKHQAQGPRFLRWAGVAGLRAPAPGVAQRPKVLRRGRPVG